VPNTGAHDSCRPSVIIDKAPMIAAWIAAILIRHPCLIRIQHTVGQVRHVWLCRELPDTIIRQDTTAVGSTAGHGLGWRRTSSRVRRFVGRQTVPKGPTAARAATLHHIHGQGRLGPLGEKVGGHDRPPLGARRTPRVMVRTIVDLGAMVFVSPGRSRGRGRQL
jgi:hypothetical protein